VKPHTLLAAGAGLAVATVAVRHALPARHSLAPLRRRFAPELAGIGAPDHVALTFDDGPHPLSTPRFLRLLEARQVSATFFLLGAQVARANGLAAELAAAGHEIAVHGHEHRCLLARGPQATYDDLARARDVIATATGRVPRWWRPPYGVLTSGALRAARRLELTPLLWTSWGRDWTSTATPDTVYRTVTRTLRGGGTILLHDSDVTSAPGSWQATLGALPRLLDHCQERGLRVGPMAEHHHREPQPSTGEVVAAARKGSLP
jgi:peptidoglycan/xylan/chitin deacetylase (PgdA/CDA1 family)